MIERHIIQMYHILTKHNLLKFNIYLDQIKQKDWQQKGNGRQEANWDWIPSWGKIHNVCSSTKHNILLSWKMKGRIFHFVLRHALSSEREGMKERIYSI